MSISSWCIECEINIALYNCKICKKIYCLSCLYNAHNNSANTNFNSHIIYSIETDQEIIPNYSKRSSLTRENSSINNNNSNPKHKSITNINNIIPNLPINNLPNLPSLPRLPSNLNNTINRPLNIPSPSNHDMTPPFIPSPISPLIHPSLIKSNASHIRRSTFFNIPSPTSLSTTPRNNEITPRNRSQSVIYTNDQISNLNITPLGTINNMANNIQLCIKCKSTATLFCRSCTLLYCSSCSFEIHKLNNNRNHNIDAISIPNIKQFKMVPSLNINDKDMVEEPSILLPQSAVNYIESITELLEEQDKIQSKVRGLIEESIYII